jgi:predicted kinase
MVGQRDGNARTMPQTVNAKTCRWRRLCLPGLLELAARSPRGAVSDTLSSVSARPLIVVSGLAASGKTTVGRLLSERLGMPLIDKDVILEALFDSLGCDDRDQRYRLSRASDELLYALADSSRGAVLVNWWNQDTAPARLRAISSSLVEVFCDCPVEVAAARFAARRRHPGHLDHLRSAEEHQEGIRRMRETYRGPLRLSEPIVTVDTSRPLNLDSVVERVRSAMATAPAVS